MVCYLLQQIQCDMLLFVNKTDKIRQKCQKMMPSSQKQIYLEKRFYLRRKATQALVLFIAVMWFLLMDQISLHSHEKQLAFPSLCAKCGINKHSCPFSCSRLIAWCQVMSICYLNNNWIIDLIVVNIYSAYISEDDNQKDLEWEREIKGERCRVHRKEGWDVKKRLMKKRCISVDHILDSFFWMKLIDCEV